MGSASRLVAIAIVVLVVVVLGYAIVRAARSATAYMREQQREHAARLGLVDAVGTQRGELQGRVSVHALNAARVNGACA